MKKSQSNCMRFITRLSQALILSALLALPASYAMANDRVCILLAMLGAANLPPHCQVDGSEPTDVPMLTSNASASISNVFWFENLEAVADASSTLTRNDHGVSFQFRTSELEPGHVYTIWWVVFNNPEACLGEMACSLEDLLENPDTDAALFWGTGEIADDLGRAHFSGHVFANSPAPGEVLFGPDSVLSSVEDAEIHLVARTHGPREPLEDAGLLHEAMTTFGGGCADLDLGPNDCEDVHVSIHLP